MNFGAVAIVAICLIILVIGALKQKSQMLFHFGVRMVLGLIGVYFCNEFLKMQNISVAVGLNPISALTIGTLGISGFGLLYGIMFYRML